MCRHRKVYISLLNRIYMKQSVLISFIFIALFAFVGFAGAQEASVAIDATYTANYNPPNATLIANMTSNIYVGNSSELFGTGNVVLPLTVNQVHVVDQNGSENVPGLYVQRGSDVFGKFIMFTTYGKNLNVSRESIKFNIQLTNARVSTIIEDFAEPYENSTNGICGIVAGNAQLDNPGEDEYNYTIHGTTAEFCSITSDGVDSVKLYYIFDDIFPPEVNNLSTNPALPLTKKENTPLTLSVNFVSNEAPIYTTLTLKNSTGEVVSVYGPVTGILGPVSLMFEVPTNLALGTYKLFMNVRDSRMNEQTLELGAITVIKEKSSHSSKKRQTLTIDEPEPEVRVHVQDSEDEIIVLGEPSKDKTFSNWSLILVILSALNLLIFLIVLIIAISRRE